MSGLRGKRRYDSLFDNALRRGWNPTLTSPVSDNFQSACVFLIEALLAEAAENKKTKIWIDIDSHKTVEDDRRPPCGVCNPSNFFPIYHGPMDRVKPEVLETVRVRCRRCKTTPFCSDFCAELGILFGHQTIYETWCQNINSRFSCADIEILGSKMPINDETLPLLLYPDAFGLVTRLFRGYGSAQTNGYGSAQAINIDDPREDVICRRLTTQGLVHELARTKPGRELFWPPSPCSSFLSSGRLDAFDICQSVRIVQNMQRICVEYHLQVIPMIHQVLDQSASQPFPPILCHLIREYLVLHPNLVFPK